MLKFTIIHDCKMSLSETEYGITQQNLRRSVGKTKWLSVFTVWRVDIVTDFDKFTEVEMNMAGIVSHTQCS